MVLLFAKDLPPEDAAYLNRELKWMTRQLGRARDFDVLLERLRRDTSYAPQTINEDALIGMVMHDRRTAAEACGAAAESARAILLFSGLPRWLRRRASAPNDSTALAERVLPRLRRWDGAVLKAGQGLETLDRGARHRLRARIKMLRYAVEAFPWLCPATGPYACALAELHALLGDFNDDAVGRRMVRRICATRGLGEVRHRRSVSRAQRREAIAAAWTRFQEAEAEWMYGRPTERASRSGVRRAVRRDVAGGSRGPGASPG